MKLWTTVIDDTCSKHAETYRIITEQYDGFRLLFSIHDAATSIIMMEDVKIYKIEIHVMYADFKGAFNAADHRIMLKHIRLLGVPNSSVDTCEHIYGVSTTDYDTPYGPTPSIDINRGTLQGDTLSPFLFTLFLESFLRWLTVDSRGNRPSFTRTNANLDEPTATS
jgi:hypothetical protein